MAEFIQPTFEQRVRQRAYELWEEAGRPGGKAEDYWGRARAEIEEADSIEAQNRIIDEARAKAGKVPDAQSG